MVPQRILVALNNNKNHARPSQRIQPVLAALNNTENQSLRRLLNSNEEEPGRQNEDELELEKFCEVDMDVEIKEEEELTWNLCASSLQPSSQGQQLAQILALGGSIPAKKRIRKANWTEEETVLLLQLYKENTYVLKPNPYKIITNKTKTGTWELITRSLNETFPGCIRTKKEMRKEELVVVVIGLLLLLLLLLMFQ
ncbi:hypothetical protein GWK47_047238 [Chionoecetes opilio]|uniref:Regulatory protein zeste n=1 Tax=Chionoecetes opilio TaxID=41210 RepID=A0A8J4Y3W3_CHIOP|nr:hypothetical protein GWK47_047238 [Chionoecetes opilio]